MTLEQRVSALEDAVRQLAAVVTADGEGLRIVDAELARQSKRFSPGWGWPPTERPSEAAVPRSQRSRR
jgi:hypothetical protein